MTTLFPQGIELTDLDVAVLKNDLLSIEQWIADAIAGKIANCKKRMDAEWKAIIDFDPLVDAVPANIDGRILFILARPDYKDRITRESEVKI